MGQLDGKVILVTGAGRGLGRAEALFLAAEGASLVVNDLGCDAEGAGADPGVVEDIGRELRAAGAHVVTSPIDVSARGAAAALVDLAVQTFGQLDAVVSNAGVSLERSVQKVEDAELARVFDVHVRASFALVAAASRAMIDAKRGGSIVLTSAPSAFFGAARRAAESGAAAAIVGLARTAAVELRRHAIRVNAIAPTARTRQTEGLPLFQGIQESSMSPEHVAPLVGFLCSDLAADVSGEILGVAGARIYALRSRETTGAFASNGAFGISAIRTAWDDIIRG